MFSMECLKEKKYLLVDKGERNGGRGGRCHYLNRDMILASVHSNIILVVYLKQIVK